MAGLRRLPRNAAVSMRRVPSLVGRRRQVAFHKKVSASNPFVVRPQPGEPHDRGIVAQNDDRQLVKTTE